jgi:hypothetical protein
MLHRFKEMLANKSEIGTVRGKHIFNREKAHKPCIFKACWLSTGTAFALRPCWLGIKEIM